MLVCCCLISINNFLIACACVCVCVYLYACFKRRIMMMRDDHSSNRRAPNKKLKNAHTQLEQYQLLLLKIVYYSRAQSTQTISFAVRFQIIIITIPKKKHPRSSYILYSNFCCCCCLKKNEKECVYKLIISRVVSVKQHLCYNNQSHIILTDKESKQHRHRHRHRRRRLNSVVGSLI